MLAFVIRVSPVDVLRRRTPKKRIQGRSQQVFTDFSLLVAEILVLAGGAVPPPVPFCTRISARLKLDA